MVAIVTGNSLGLSLTSLATLGQNGAEGNSRTGRNGEQVFVNASNGNLIVQDQDDYLSARGLDLSAVRTYDAAGHLKVYRPIGDTTGSAVTTAYAITLGQCE